MRGMLGPQAFNNIRGLIVLLRATGDFRSRRIRNRCTMHIKPTVNLIAANLGTSHTSDELINNMDIAFTQPHTGLSINHLFSSS